MGNSKIALISIVSRRGATRSIILRVAAGLSKEQCLIGNNQKKRNLTSSSVNPAVNEEGSLSSPSIQNLTVTTINQENGDNQEHLKGSTQRNNIKFREYEFPSYLKHSMSPKEPNIEAAHPAHHYISGGMPCDPRPPPFRLTEYGEESLYSLVLLRHGESEWNRLNRYTGWVDVPLTVEGKNEARTAGRLLRENGIEIDQAFTSVLKRASSSCNMALNSSDQHWVPVTKTWRLNERHYGALQGYNKDTAWRELDLDQELVMQMRRAYDVRPPRMENDHPNWHGNDRR